MQFRPRKNGFRLPGLKPGASTQRLKPRSLGGALTARLKSCPDTQPTTSDSQEKNAISAEEEWIRLSRAEAQSVLRRFLAGLKPGASTQRLKPRSLGARLRHDSSRALTRSPQRRRSQVHATGAGRLRTRFAPDRPGTLPQISPPELAPPSALVSPALAKPQEAPRATPVTRSTG